MEEVASVGPAAAGCMAGTVQAGAAPKRRRLQRTPTINHDEVNMRSLICSKQVVPPNTHHDGTLLDCLASEHATAFEQILFQRSPRTFTGQHTWASCCSGSEGAHFVMKAVEKAWPDVVLKQVFACEKDPAKRNWICNLVNSGHTASGQDQVCIFQDICDLGNEMAQCHTHGRMCKVPGCDFLVVGTSCKDLSKMNNTKFKEPVLAMHTSPGGTATTFRGLLSFLDSHSVDVVIYENSDNLDHNGGGQPQSANGNQTGGVSNLDIFQSEMSARRFEGQNMVLNAKQFGSAASRRRFWSVLFKTGDPRSFLEFGDRTLAAVFKTFRGLLKVCQRTPPSLETVLLKSTDEHVERELLRRTALGQPTSAFSWVPEHQKLYAALRIQWGGLPHTWLPPAHGGTRLWPHVRNLCWCTDSTCPCLRVGVWNARPSSNAQSWGSHWTRAQTATTRPHVGKMGKQFLLRACCRDKCFGCTFLGMRSGSCWAAKHSCCKASPCAECRSQAAREVARKCQNVSCTTLRATP